MGDNIAAYRIQVQGLVQGVGFRPFIYRIASGNSLTGWVENRNDGVTIHVEGKESDIQKFISDIGTKAPPASRIQSVKRSIIEPGHYSGFEIVKSSYFG